MNDSQDQKGQNPKPDGDYYQILTQNESDQGKFRVAFTNGNILTGIPFARSMQTHENTKFIMQVSGRNIECSISEISSLERVPFDSENSQN